MRSRFFDSSITPSSMVRYAFLNVVLFAVLYNKILPAANRSILSSTEARYFERRATDESNAFYAAGNITLLVNVLGVLAYLLLESIYDKNHQPPAPQQRGNA